MEETLPSLIIVATDATHYSWCIVSFLIGYCPPPQVNVTVDYIRAATGPGEGTPAFPERTCATVTIGGM